MNEDEKRELATVVRQALRDELEAAGARASGTITQDAIAGAVRAELARHQRSGADLAEALHLSRVTIGGRLSGAYPFKLNELEAVARFLDISVDIIMASANLGKSLVKIPVPAPITDTWAQPPGGGRNRRRL